MSFDTDLYGLVLDDWHRPGQTVSVNPTLRSSDYGVGSMPSGYTPIKMSGATLKGAVMLAVGDTAIWIGGQMGAPVVAGRAGYARHFYRGANRGRVWTEVEYDPPWCWPVIQGAWVVGTRIYIACNQMLSNVFYDTFPTDPTLIGVTIKLWYSDDLGDTWYLAGDDHDSHDPKSAAPGSADTSEHNYEVLLASGWVPGSTIAGQAYASCIHQSRLWLFREGRIKIVIAGKSYWRKATGAWSAPVDMTTSLLTKDTCLVASEVKNLECSEYPYTYVSPFYEDPITDPKYPIRCMSFPDHMLVGFGVNLLDSTKTSGVLHVVADGNKLSWLGMSHSAAWSLDVDETDPNWAVGGIPVGYEPLLHSCGVVQYRDQVWVIGGTLTGNRLNSVSLWLNRIKTSRDGKTWRLVRFSQPDPENPYPDTPPAYPEAGFQNVPMRCLDTQACFFASTKELMLSFCWVGHDYYDDQLGKLVNGSVSPTQTSMFMNFMHSQSIPFPEVIPVETPWYNFPIGGEPGTSPSAPGMSGDFSATGDLLRCLRIDLSANTISAGCGYPFVSSLQNSSPTALPGQLPDKMLVGDKLGYLNKAMVPEAAGLGNPSKFVLWFCAAGSDQTTIVLDIATRQSYLPAHFLAGLTVRVALTSGTYEERTIVDNTHDTITVAALTSAPVAGTKIWIAPMDCAALLAENRYQFPARLVNLRVNLANYQGDDQPFSVGIRRGEGPRRFGEFDIDDALTQTVTQRQLEAGGGVVGIMPHASRSLTYDIRITPNGGGDLEIGPLWLTENVQPGEGGLS